MSWAESGAVTSIRVAALLGLVLGLAAPGVYAADDHLVRIEEVLVGANGDSRVQLVQLTIAPGAAPEWAPRTGEASHRAALTTFDATGEQIASFAFQSDPPIGPPHPDHGGHSLLVATQAFVDLTGVAADYVIASILPVPDGMVCFETNAPLVALKHCVAFGDYRGLEESDLCLPPTLNGFPGPAVPIAGGLPLGLHRFRDDGPTEAFGCGHDNTSFALETPSPRNSAGATAAIPVASLVDQGRVLFEQETFNGNGRTCGTCHRNGNHFALPPTTIAAMFAADPLDPLFVAENAPALTELENTCLLRMGNERGLILENISGFDRSPSFRNSPHLLNIASTAPYGLSAGFDDLRDFSVGAVQQHFPRTLARNSDPGAGPLDFRTPDEFELMAMEAFMNGIRFPEDGNLDLDRMIGLAVRIGADAGAIQRGRDLVTGVEGQARCSLCHSGPTLSDADGSLGLGTGNLAFDIGIAFRDENDDDGCAGGPGDPDASFPSEFRRFSTPPLIGVAATAPFFHDHSAFDLGSAVSHYASNEFQSSEAAGIMEQIGAMIILTDAEIDDIVAFLAAISIDPTGVPLTCGDGVLDPSEECDDGGVTEGDCCSPTCRLEGCALCDDGVDNDGDEKTDYPEDPGCASPSADVEDPPCDDHLDNDQDGFCDTDASVCLDGAIPGDSKCGAAFLAETPVCSDGLDNDEDGLVDLNDPQCGSPTQRSETLACGLGFELALILPVLVATRRLRRRATRVSLTANAPAAVD